MNKAKIPFLLCPRVAPSTASVSVSSRKPGRLRRSLHGFTGAGGRIPEGVKGPAVSRSILAGLLLSLFLAGAGASSGASLTQYTAEIGAGDWLEGEEGHNPGTSFVTFPGWRGGENRHTIHAMGYDVTGSAEAAGYLVTSSTAGRDPALPQGISAYLTFGPSSVENPSRLLWVEFDIRDFDPGDGYFTEFGHFGGEAGALVIAGADIVYAVDHTGRVPLEGKISAAAPGASATLRMETGTVPENYFMGMGMNWVPGTPGASFRIEAVRFGYQVEGVPEPSATLLTGGAAFGLLLRRRRMVTA